MRTRSQSRNNFPQQEASPAIVEPLRIELPFLEDQFQEDPPKDPPEVSMTDNQTMAELLQAPTEGYEDAIVIPEIPANNFELKHGLINLVQNKQFFGHDKEDPHAHIRYFKLTSTMRVQNSKSKVRQTRAKAVIAKVSTSSSTPAISSEVSELKDMVRALLLDKKNQSSAPAPSSTPAPVKAIEPNCVTCGGSGTLPSNTITNPKEDLKGITTRNGAAYQGPTIPTQSKVVKQGTEVTKDQVQTPSSQSIAPVQPSVIRSETQTPVSELVVSPVSVPMPNLKSSIPYPSRCDNERRRDQANEQIEKFYKIFKDMSFEISFTDALILMPKFASTLKALIGNKEKLSEMARTSINEHSDFVVVDFEPDPRVPLILERCFLKIGQALIDVHKGELTLQYSQEVLSFSDTTASGNPTPYDDPIVSTTSPTLTLFGDSNFLLFKEADAFLGLEDDPNSPEFNPFYYDPEGDILLLEAILNSKPLPPLPNHEQYLPLFKKELKVCEAKTVKSFVDEPSEVELKDLPPHLEYAFLEGDNKLPVIIAKELGDKEKSALIKVLKSHKRAIAWKLSDTQGINPEFCTHKILMEEVYKPAVQHQRRVNPKIHNVIKKEVEKLLDAGLIYPISDSPWVSPVYCVPKKGGFTIVENEENELIPTRLVTGWRVCIDYRKLNEATRKDHFPLPFMDQMLKRLARNEYYCFLNGVFRYFQIPIDPRDQEKTTFTYPYETFAYRRMPFGLCNAPGTFQRCMLAIFHDMVEKTMEVFMDDFSVFGNSFENCLSRLDKMLQRCEDTNLSLNWEKSHFMVKEGIVLGHKISKNKIEVDKAKVDVIAKLPHPTTVKGAVLGQRHEKHFKPIHYASKTMNDAESNYTTTEKEMLAVVYAFEKFRSCLIMNKSIVHTDHSALKYLFTKKDAKARLLRFGAPRAIISDRGTHFCNDQFAKFMLKYGVTHRLSTAYHLQTSGIVKFFVLLVLSFIHKNFTSSASFWESQYPNLID
nr:reverse transcriptase domain-containing protein [Tanacetum cinerariifolium]